jgi:hypothetical protein
MIPDPPHPIFCLTDSPPDLSGTTHLFPLLQDSSKYIVLFFIGEHALHEPHPLFQNFVASCKPYRSSLRPAIIARAYHIGGLRKPNWGNDDTLFLATKTTVTEQVYGLNGKNDMGLIVIRPDGYVAYSDLVDATGNAFRRLDTWLTTVLIKS